MAPGELSGTERAPASRGPAGEGAPLVVVVDDDPTGTQMATGVGVLLHRDRALMVRALREEGSVYVQTNSRALTEEAAVRLAKELREDVDAAAAELGWPVLVVLRGDSTLRGHVVAECDVFARGAGRVLFVPAFPQGGRTTVGGVHRVVVDGTAVDAGDTEFAEDPVFGFRSSHLVDWVAEKGLRRALPVPLDALRRSGGSAVRAALEQAGPGEFVVPDVEADEDVALVEVGLREALAAGVEVVVRSAATLAARCAGRLSTSFLARPVPVSGEGVLVVCGSHTRASSAQLAELVRELGTAPVVVATDDAYADADAAGAAAGREALRRLREDGVAVLATERTRRAEDDSVAHGELVMRALVRATSEVVGDVRTVVSKGGITSAEVARAGFGAVRAHVRGQVAAGISVWDLPGGAGCAPGTQVVVPGNVGDSSTLVDVLRALEPTATTRTAPDGARPTTDRSLR